MRTRVSSKGQIVLPAELRRQDGVEAGQEFEVERVERGEYRLVRRASRANEGVVDWLLACPDKGFFTPLPSESTISAGTSSPNPRPSPCSPSRDSASRSAPAARALTSRDN